MQKETYEELTETFKTIIERMDIPRPPGELLDFVFLSNLDEELYHKAEAAGIQEGLISSMIAFFFNGMVWTFGHEILADKIEELKTRYGQQAFE